LLFEELQEDSKSLFSCLMVNRLWCETAIPILWRNPWCYNDVNYSNKSYLFVIISSYLTNDIKKLLTRQGIVIPSVSNQSLLFDYLSFCRSMNMIVIDKIFSTVTYRNQFFLFLLQREIYNLFIRKCPEFKYLDIRSIKHQIYYFPEAQIRLSSLCELKCDKSIEPSYFYGLSCICQNIERMTIINTDTKVNNGIVKLIEVQKNLKYFEWEDDFDDEYFRENPYKEIFMALVKKEDTLNHLIVSFQFVEYANSYHYTFLQWVLSRLRKLKTLKFFPSYLNEYDLEVHIKLLVYHDLEIFKIDDIEHKTVTCIIEHSGGRLKEILINYDPYNGHDAFIKDSLVLFRTIREKCPLIERFSLDFPFTKDHIIEFEKLLRICQNVRVLVIDVMPSVSFNIEKLHKERWENGEIILETIIKSAPINLREFRFFKEVKFSLRALEKFLENWRGQPISLITTDPIYGENDYKKLISKYKNNGVIKDFNYNFLSDMYS
jgi:hypothetical protein